MEQAAEQSAEKPAADVKVKITRDKGHWHGGTKHPKDAVISVTEGDAKTIVDSLKAGERVTKGK